MVSRTPRVNWSKYIPNDVFSIIKTTFFLWGSASRFCVGAHHHFCKRRMCYGYMKAGLTVQRVLCTSSQLAWTCRDASARSLPNADRTQGSLHVQGARLALQRVLCTSSQLAWTCKESFARSSFREIQSIDILVPKIWYHVPRPSNAQNIPQTTSFQ